VADRAALITGGSSGIGLAIARVLGSEGYAITLSSRRPEKLEAAASELREAGFEVGTVPANVAEEEEVIALVRAHREHFGRLDVLVNNAGVGIGQPIDAIVTKHLDMQLAVNLRSFVIATREALPLLRESGSEHGKALIVNTASIAGKSGQPWISVYSATKAAIIGFSQATQKEVSAEGIQVTALCPGFVDTAMSEWVQEQIKPEEMIRPEDIGESVRMLLNTSPNCRIPEIIFQRAGEVVGPGA
jgi:NAD(P)-dependent dehydrogenase (short-subunit alcohol dehydrogenase family)